MFGKKKKEAEKVTAKTKADKKEVTSKKDGNKKVSSKTETKKVVNAPSANNEKQKNTKVSENKKPASENEVKAGIYRVIYDKTDRNWKIKRDGAKRIIDSKSTKEEALIRVKELSEGNDVGYVVYKKDGKFQKK